MVGRMKIDAPFCLGSGVRGAPFKWLNMTDEVPWPPEMNQYCD